MLEAYAPILILLTISVLNAVGMVVASHFLGPIRPTAAKRAPYESGVTPLGDTRERFSVKFYMVAILFIVFDLETVFLIPWGVSFRTLGLFGFVEMLVFIAVLLVGFVYIWKKGALQWD
ncbi:MAG TPA: NADH-quinone oxidoreductase subunit A [Gemmatimonadales bacterium]|nr:NADH-quinone oxidoreductase subunit A [Gemmatimonadales bacterium]